MPKIARELCPLCQIEANFFCTIEAIDYWECAGCEFVFAETELLDKIDSGEAVRSYDASYWQMELESARERAFGPAMARLAEVILYARNPIRRFIDIYSGPGYFLDAVERYLPHVADRFFAVELYPPPEQYRTRHANYLVGDLSALTDKFQAGMCMEVLEHLTPRMAVQLASQLAEVADPQAIFLFNTGLVSYVKQQDPAYIDPFRRGHITFWSVSAARKIFEPAGFSVFPIRGKTWAFAVEFQSRATPEEILNDRIWSANADNKSILSDPVNGSLMYVLGFDTARVP